MQGSKGDTDVKHRFLNSVGEGKGGMIWENSIETYTLPYVGRWPVQVWCMKQGTQSLYSGTTRGIWGERDVGGGVWDGGTHVYPRLIHADVWQKTSHSVVFNALDNSPLLKVLSSTGFPSVFYGHISTVFLFYLTPNYVSQDLVLGLLFFLFHGLSWWPHPF